MVITVKNVPRSLAARLKARAKEHHRSMQGEVMDILEAAAGGRMGVGELAAWVRKKGIRSPSESAKIVREMRDAR